MRKGKKLLPVLLTLAMTLAFSGCGNTKPAATENIATVAPTEAAVVSGDGTLQDGDYTAKGKGLAGDVEVKVTIANGAITAVEVLSHNETAGISDPAIENIPANIISAQGLKVDVISGATLTSNAIIEAVTTCLTQAGGDIEVLKTKGVELVAVEDEVVDTDVLVVGAGIAGLSAAVSAAEEGANVLVLEKMASVGGASILCGGEVLAAGSDMQAEQGIVDSAEALKNYWIEAGEGNVSEELLTFVANNSGNTVNWLKDRGVKFSDVTFSYYYPNQDPYRNHATENYIGSDLILPLYEKAKALGVEFRFETPAETLINENGVIKGAVASNQGRTITVNAKNTILATGGFANNEELMNEYIPSVQAFGTYLGAAHNGDGLIMAREVGAEIVAGGGGIINPMDLGKTKYTDAGGIFLNVTPEGKRYSNENDYWFKRSAELYHEEGFNHYYAIFDSKTSNAALEEAIANKTAYKANTIEELATMISMEPSVLADTVKTYNEACATGVDTVFGKPAVGLVGNRTENLKELQLLSSIEEGPYYAILFNTSTITGTFGGPKININAQVIATTGDVIPGLFAAGEVANGQFFYKRYPCSGSSIQTSATMGIEAGKFAAQAAK